jgi:hypothetical protein
VKTQILNEIPFQPTLEEAARALRIRSGTASVDQLHQLLDRARDIARPKAAFRPVRVEERTEDRITLDGVTFQSRVLQVNTKDIHRMFAYVATCGQELEEWKGSFDDLVESYYADQINALALQSAREALHEHLRTRYQLNNSSTMNPGSLEDWPISEQVPLFELLGDVSGLIGVRLLPSMLMDPGQSVSGLRFASESDFTSCQLCPIENCPHRKAPYQAGLYQEKYADGTHP